MTRAEIKTMLTIGSIPLAYDHFPKNQQVTAPYIVYFEEPFSVYADNTNYRKGVTIQAEFCSVTKDWTTEALIEASLEGKDLTYQKSEGYNEDEKIYQTGYTFSTFLD